MKSKERLRAALLGQPVDRLPWSPNLCYLFETLPAEIQKLGHMGVCKLVGADLLNRFVESPTLRIEPDEMKTVEWQENGRRYVETQTPVGSIRKAFQRSDEGGGTEFLIEHPLKSIEDYKVQIWIEEHVRLERNPDAAPSDESLDFAVLLPGPDMIKSTFQRMVERLIGTQQLAYDLMDFPEEVDALWEACRANNRKALKIAAETDFEFFLTIEDTSTQNYSPAMYEQYVLPEVSEWVKVLGENDKYFVQHACGHIKGLLPAMNRSGLLAVESLSPAPTGNLTVKEAREGLDPNIGIIGGIEPTELLNRSLDELGPYVEQVIEDARGGPFILANADSCPPGVSLEKFKLITEIAQSTTW